MSTNSIVCILWDCKHKTKNILNGYINIYGNLTLYLHT